MRARVKLAASVWLTLVLVGLPSVASPDVQSSPGEAPLKLGEVLDSVGRHFPELLAAREELLRAEARLTEARGSFDTDFSVVGGGEFLGFYENRLFDMELSQPLAAGGLELSGGYRRGTGDFAAWDGDLKTQTDGEFRAEIRAPLLRDRSIDRRRIGLRDARLQQEQVGPELSRLTQEVRQEASLRYWRWMAAGERLAIAERLLRFAESRQEAIQAGVEEGLLPRIDLADNERLVAERSAIRIQAERELEQAALGLSLYLRDSLGQPRIPGRAELPGPFPGLPPALASTPEQARAEALDRRPELRALAIEQERVALSLRGARNRVLPQADLRVKASQDFGEPTTVPDDKGPFELQAGLMISVPLQRRSARGAVQRIQAEQRQLDQEVRLARDTIVLEVEDARSALGRARERLVEARRSVELARELESAERFQMREGNSDLLRLNIRERQSAQAAAFEVEATQEYFEAWTRYQVVLGRAEDPMRMIP